MIIIREVPLVALQKALFKALKDGQTTTIYGGDAPEGAKLPYITFGSTTAKPILVKNAEMWNATINLEVWGNNKQRQVVNDILNDLVTISTFRGESLSMDNFDVVKVDVDLVETFPEQTTGYHGSMTLLFALSKKG